jgi:hypothetical protein
MPAATAHELETGKGEAIMTKKKVTKAKPIRLTVGEKVAAREAARQIMNGINWDRTPQGTDYWVGVYQNLGASKGEEGEHG